MKILFVTFEYFPEDRGVGIAITNFARSLRKRGYEVIVICPSKNLRLPSQYLDEGVLVKRIGVPYSNNKKLSKIISGLLYPYYAIKSIIRENPSIIMGEGWNHESGLIAFLSYVLFRYRAVMRVHATIVSYNKMYNPLTKLILNLSFRVIPVITTNEEMKQEILNEYGIITPVLPNTYISNIQKNIISKDYYKKKFKLESSRTNLLAVGRLEQVKGFQVLIQALKKLTDCNLYLIGDGSLKTYINNFLIKFKLKNVFMLGRQSNDVVKEYMQACDILIIPSIQEGLSMTLIEGISLGIPIIITKTGGAKALFKNNKGAYLIPANNVKAIIKAVNIMRNDISLQKKLLIEAQNIFKENFSSDSVIDKFEEIFMIKK